MLDGAGDNMAGIRLPILEDYALESQIARFAAAAGEDDFVRHGAKQIGNLPAGLGDGIVSGIAEFVGA
jgi:hypothetical protein